eukprot:SM000320S12011  [mRNA]  locus=s320:74013:76104:- [translate_table: standard]
MGCTYMQQFWDWSSDELAQYDLPALLQAINVTTHAPKVHFIGYNQGTVVGLAAATTQAYLVASLASMTLIGPIIYLGNVTSPTLQRWGTGFTPDEIIYQTGYGAAVYNITAYALSLAFTYKPCNIDQAFYNLLARAGVSFTAGQTTDQTISNSFGRLAEVRSGLFQHWKYLQESSNTFYYGSADPPQYMLTNLPVDTPIFIVSGGNDWMADTANVAKLVAQLPAATQQLHIPSYAHLDLIHSRTVEQDVNTPIVNFLKGV